MLGSVEKGKNGISQLYFNCYIFLLYKNNRKIASKKEDEYSNFLMKRIKLAGLLKVWQIHLDSLFPHEIY